MGDDFRVDYFHTVSWSLAHTCIVVVLLPSWAGRPGPMENLLYNFVLCPISQYNNY